MENGVYVGVFNSIDTVLYKVTELKAQGVSEEKICAVTNVEDNLLMLQGQTAICLLGAEGGKWLDHSTGVNLDEESIIKSFYQIGFNEQQARIYYEEVRTGGIALFVCEDSLSIDNEQMDSSVQRSPSGKMLERQDSEQQLVESDLTMPRINTDHL